MNSGGNKGFTIVETLIVLAIASTIIVVVLLAVPGLQRSSRNTTARTAANNVVSGWSEQMAALFGASPGLPTGGSAGSISINSVTYKLASVVKPIVGTQSGSTATTFSYSASTTAFTNGAASTVAPNSLVVVFTATCSGTSAATGTTTQIAVFYPIENGGTGSVGCIQG